VDNHVHQTTRQPQSRIRRKTSSQIHTSPSRLRQRTRTVWDPNRLYLSRPIPSPLHQHNFGDQLRAKHAETPHETSSNCTLTPGTPATTQKSRRAHTKNTPLHIKDFAMMQTANLSKDKSDNCSLYSRHMFDEREHSRINKKKRNSINSQKRTPPKAEQKKNQQPPTSRPKTALAFSRPMQSSHRGNPPSTVRQPHHPPSNHHLQTPRNPRQTKETNRKHQNTGTRPSNSRK
jgi:hypothetical protein